jgi:hypothetical protein
MSEPAAHDNGAPNSGGMFSAVGEAATPVAEVLITGRFDERPGYVTRRSRGARSWLLMWTDGGAGQIRHGE